MISMKRDHKNTNYLPVTMFYFVEVSDEGLSVSLAAPPVDGKANTELVRYLSQMLGIRKSAVIIQQVKTTSI